MDDASLVGRRRFGHLCCGALALGAMGLTAAPRPARAATGHGPKSELTPAQALALLKEGNVQFLADKLPSQAGTDRARRMALARVQTPMAVLVGCSDSRVPPELLFGRGLGEMFIVRNAGHILDIDAIGSIEYGVHVLGVPLVVVMGHERCGAVAAAMDVVLNNTAYPGNIGEMLHPLLPAVLKARSNLGARASDTDALLDASVRENVRREVQRLRTSQTLLADPLARKAVMVVGARYDLDDGKVDFFDV